MLAVTDIASGVRRELAGVDHVAGNEYPRWSGDGRWILVSTCPAVVINVNSGLQLTLSGSENPYETRVDWWPDRGSASILMLGGRDGSYQVSALDLSSDTHTAVSEVRLPLQQDLDLRRHLISYPCVSPDTNDVLIGVSLGPPGDYQKEFGSRSRVALLNAVTGEINQLFDAFVNGTEVEREHDGWRWSRTVRPTPAWDLAASLQSQLEPCPVPPVRLTKLSPTPPYGCGLRNEWRPWTSIRKFGP